MFSSFKRLNRYFKSFLKRSNSHGSHLIVACSGGGDSVALAHLAGKYHQGELSIAFVQHMLRGDESLEDENFLKTLVLDLRNRHNRVIGIHILNGCFAGSKGQGVESVAREIRRNQLAILAKQIGSNSVMMGHNLNDLAETFLMKLARGAGPGGMGAIKSRTFLSEGIGLYRPLLTFNRQFLREFLFAEGISWRNDSSNHSCHFSRNFVRLNVIEPFVLRYGNKILKRIYAHARWVEETAKYNSDRTAKVLRLLELPKAGPKVVLRRPKINELKVRQLSAIFHFIWKRENWPARELTKKHLIRMSKHILQNKPMAVLPSGIRFHVDEHVISLGPDFPDLKIRANPNV